MRVEGNVPLIVMEMVITMMNSSLTSTKTDVRMHGLYLKGLVDLPATVVYKSDIRDYNGLTSDVDLSP